MNESSTALESASLGSKLGGDASNGSSLSIANEKTTALARFNERLSEWCSSILVKETRQALKSRQFIWTYLALMICVGVWTVFGLANTNNQYQAGRELLAGFWVILGFPLALIIPFSAYRSLSREFEDGTINLISITTMKPYQIVTGKFGSAVLQMLTYLSVLAPCICFTYLLRGISISQIVLGLSICVGGSICLTVLGLFLAGVFRSRTLGVGVSVLFVLFLGWLYYCWCEIIWDITRYSSNITDEPEFWIVAYAFVAFFGSTAVLLLVAAAAQISFPADNRSTPIRIAMFVQQILFFGLLIMMIPLAPREDLAIWVMLLFAGHYWLIMGFLMIGESVFISRRVQRTLPRTFLSRSMFSLLMPGSGRGFLYAVANIWTCGIVLLLIVGFADFLVDEQSQQLFGGRRFGGNASWVVTSEMISQALITCLFVSWFLSIIYLAMRCFENRKKQWSTGVGSTVSLLLGALLIAGLSIGSFIVHMNYISWRNGDMMSVPLMVNWYLISYEVAESGFGGSFPRMAVWYFLFAIQKVIVIGIAVALASRELLVRPIAVPQRVQIEAQKSVKSNVPAGETIDEIFGELKK